MIWFKVPSTLVSKLFKKLWFCGRKCIIPHTVLWIISSLNPSLSPILINRELTFNHKPLIIIYLVTYDFLILLVTKLYMVNGIFFWLPDNAVKYSTPKSSYIFCRSHVHLKQIKKNMQYLIIDVCAFFIIILERRRDVQLQVQLFVITNITKSYVTYIVKIIMNFVVWAKCICDLKACKNVLS